MLKRFKTASTCIISLLLFFVVLSFVGGNQNELQEPLLPMNVHEASLGDSYGYTVSADGTGILLSGAFGTERYESVTLALNSVEDGAHVVFSQGFSCEGFVVKRSLALSGEIALIGGNISIENSHVSLDGISINLGDGALLIKGGSVTLVSGSLSSNGCAVVLDYSSRDCFTMMGGSINSRLDCVRLSKGGASILGGQITSASGYAVYASAALTLGGAPKIVGDEHDIFISEPILNAVREGGFTGDLDILTGMPLKRGNATPIMLGADGVDLTKITVSDSLGVRYKLTFLEECHGVSETDFLGVYLPFAMRFYDNDTLLYEYEYLQGQTPIKPTAPTKLGYTFLGWYKDYTLSEAYSFSDGVDGDITLFASFSLVPPNYEILPMEFTYDAKSRTLSVSEVTHPLAELGNFGYEWYKDSVSLGVGAMGINITDVCDSGRYKCKLTFSYNGDYVSTFTPEVSVTVLRRQVEIPTVLPKEYSGFALTPEIEESIYYTYDKVSYTDVGIYGITLTLRDAENCAFSGTDSNLATVNFEIYRAKNRFLNAPEVGRAFVGAPPVVVAHPLFGEYTVEYFVDGVWTANYPAAVGEYMLRVSVAQSDNYDGAVSNAVLFSVEIDSCVGIGFDTPPVKTEYLAFQKIDLSGASLYASYLSGKRVSIDSSSVEVVYKTGQSLRVFDRSVTLTYEGASLPLSVTVSPREYDISAITVVESNFIYIGKTLRPEACGEVIGLDGVPLLYTVRGGATDVGEYTAYIDFVSESFNYSTPEPLAISFKITPLEVAAVYGQTSFVYDKTPKLPSGYFLSVTGERVELVVSGAMSDAGEYIATASSASANYKIKNSNIGFVITKATLDLSGARWSESSFVYNGQEHSVTLGGLPEGVSVIGYAGRSATDVGVYRAVASLLYDERNYVSDGLLEHNFEITPAVYDTSGIVFLDTVSTYNGKAQTPSVSGTLPIGYDGSSPEYSFSLCPTDVTDGAVSVTVNFTTLSKNYLAPEPRTVKVTVLPRKIEVVWSNLAFIYDGFVKLPSAYSDECEIVVSGGGADAGSYLARVTAPSKNFSIINPSATFVIAKRSNSFTEQPSIVGGFVGDRLQPYGKAQHGEVVFSYYKDISLTEKASLPLAAGEYYMVAEVGEDRNYKSLASTPIRFTVTPVLPTVLSVTLKVSTLRAFEKLADGEIEAYYVNNNGTYTALGASSLLIEYENGDSLRVGDEFVNISAGGFTVKLTVKVDRAVYDTSSVTWTNTNFVYDGNEKVSTLAGLPNGVTVVSYTKNSATDAGVYLLGATLAYDEKNYYPPSLPTAYLVIEKQKISLPSDIIFEYDGKEKTLTVIDTDYYKGASISAAKCGSYSLPITLFDLNNYELEGGRSSVTLTVLPRHVALRVTDKNGGYAIDSGSIINGDDLETSVYEKDGYVYVSIQNPNYIADIIPFDLSSDKDTLWIILLVILILLILFIGGYIIYLRRASLAVVLTGVKVRLFTKSTPVSTVPEVSEEKPTTLLAVDAEYADGAISDAMAKDLIRKSNSPIFTCGVGKYTISLSDISRAFVSGDRVDINALKAKGLIPENCSYIKIDGLGIIDKALHITADSFALCAVKMIALTGGTATRARTRIRKSK